MSVGSKADHFFQVLKDRFFGLFNSVVIAKENEGSGEEWKGEVEERRKKEGKGDNAQAIGRLLYFTTCCIGQASKQVRFFF